MSLLKMLSIRTRRNLECKILLTFFIFIVIIIMSIIVGYFYNRESNGDYDYFYFEHQSLELFGENESSERLVKKFPALIKSRHNNQLLDPVIFIAGYPGSGSKVVKKVIERFANITCNKQTKVITDFLKMGNKWNQSETELTRLENGGIDQILLFELLSGFTRDIVYGQSVKSQPIVCVHEELAYLYGAYLDQFFPTAKFIFVVRDGRTVVHSALKHLPPPLRKPDKYRTDFLAWATDMNHLMKGCEQLGFEKCIIVRYEDLVVSSWDTLDSIFYFLGIVSKLPIERSGPIIQNASGVYNALSRREPIAQEALNQATIIANTLLALGYDPKLYVAGNSAQDLDL